MTRPKAPDDDPCRCEFRRMMWGLAAGLLSLIGVSSIRHEWVSEHLYLTLAVGAVACIIGTGSGFGDAIYYQCLMSQNKRQEDITLPTIAAVLRGGKFKLRRYPAGCLGQRSLWGRLFPFHRDAPRL